MWRLRWLASKISFASSAEPFERRTTDSAQHKLGDLVFEMLFDLAACAQIGAVAEFTRAEILKSQGLHRMIRKMLSVEDSY